VRLLYDSVLSSKKTISPRGAAKEQTPALRRVAPGHMAACHFAEQLQLQGVVATPTRANGAIVGASPAMPEGQ